MDETQQTVPDRAHAGGGMVRAVVNGKRDLLEVKIDPEVVKSTNFFNLALVDLLVKPWGRVPSKAW